MTEQIQNVTFTFYRQRKNAENFTMHRCQCAGAAPSENTCELFPLAGLETVATPKDPNTWNYNKNVNILYLQLSSSI